MILELGYSFHRSAGDGLLLALQINLGHLDVDAHRVQPPVAEQVLQRQQVAAVAQEIDGEGVAETMNPASGTLAC